MYKLLWLLCIHFINFTIFNSFIKKFCKKLQQGKIMLLSSQPLLFHLNIIQAASFASETYYARFYTETLHFKLSQYNTFISNVSEAFILLSKKVKRTFISKVLFGRTFLQNIIEESMRKNLILNCLELINFQVDFFFFFRNKFEALNDQFIKRIKS